MLHYFMLEENTEMGTVPVIKFARFIIHHIIYYILNIIIYLFIDLFISIFIYLF